jgi:predicted nucleic acid-binding protein
VKSVLVDTGPLVAILDRSDNRHAACVSVLRQARAPLVTVWPVLTEASHLLSFSAKAQASLLELVINGTVRVEPLGDLDVSRMRELMSKYADLPMDLADAALVCVAERLRLRTVLTTDRRDFSLYRTKTKAKLTLLP